MEEEKLVYQVPEIDIIALEADIPAVSQPGDTPIYG